MITISIGLAHRSSVKNHPHKEKANIRYTQKTWARWWVLVVAALVIQTSSGCKYRPHPIDFQSLPASITTRLTILNTSIANAVKSDKAVAVSANVVYQDKVIWEGAFGVLKKDVTPTKSPTTNTLYPVSSVSKILTALMLFKLKNDNKIKSLDETIEDYESTFSVRNPFKKTHKVTLREIVTQRSGLPREAPCYPDILTNLCPHAHKTMLARLKNVSLATEPGTTPRYSNLAFAILGQILAKRFAKPGSNFGQWMKDELLSVVGMTDSAFPSSVSQYQDMPTGYVDKTTASAQPARLWGWLDPAGGLFTSVSDLAKLEIELMKTSGRVLSDVLTEQFFKPDYIFSDGKSMVGTPWEIKFKEGYPLRTKTGSVYGYRAYVAMVPELRLGFNVLCSGCSSWISTVEQHVASIVKSFKDQLTVATAKKLSLPPDPKPFIGRYTKSNVPNIKVIEIKEETGYLSVEINGTPLFRLTYTAPYTFRIVHIPTLPCLRKYIFGIENDVVVFDKPTTSDGVSPGFILSDAHPSGRSYFAR